MATVTLVAGGAWVFMTVVLEHELEQIKGPGLSGRCLWSYMTQARDQMVIGVWSVTSSCGGSVQSSWDRWLEDKIENEERGEMRWSSQRIGRAAQRTRGRVGGDESTMETYGGQ